MRRPAQIAAVAAAVVVIGGGGAAAALATGGDSSSHGPVTTTSASPDTNGEGQAAKAEDQATKAQGPTGKISASQARKIAHQRIPGGTVTDLDLDREHGRAVWEVELTKQHRDYDVHIDAATGNVVTVHADRSDTGD